MCFSCARRGHIADACLLKDSSGQAPKNKHFNVNAQNSTSRKYPVQSKTYRTHSLTEGSNEEPYPESQYILYKLSSHTNSIRDIFRVNGVEINMDVDTGASLTVISEATQNRLFGKRTLSSFEETLLLTYTGDAPSLLGRNWLTCLRHC